MSDLLIDTNFYTEIMTGEVRAIEIIQIHERLLMSPVVLGELLAGFKGGTQESQNIIYLNRFLSQDRVAMIDVTQDTSRVFALIWNQLKKQGTPIPQNDAWIAASALEHGVALATHDKHFHNISGLTIIN